LKFDPQMECTAELNSLSKSFNMAGWRVGALFGHKDLIDAVVSVKSNVDSGMFIPLQKGAVAALQVDTQWHKDRNAIYYQRRKIVREIFDLLGFTYDPEQVGLFVWARAPSKVSDVTVYLDDILLKAKVFITPGEIFGSNGVNFA